MAFLANMVASTMCTMFDDPTICDVHFPTLQPFVRIVERFHVTGGVFVPQLIHQLRLFGFGNVAQHRLDVGTMRIRIDRGVTSSGRRRIDRTGNAFNYSLTALLKSKIVQFPLVGLRRTVLYEIFSVQ